MSQLTFTAADGAEAQAGKPMTGTAVFSDCGTYRYRLTREIDQPFTPATTVTWVMLNPSTATADTDDPTIRRCIGFARQWGYSRLIVVNLFALRTTRPVHLAEHDDPVGPENAEHLREAKADADRVICAWGAWPRSHRWLRAELEVVAGGPYERQLYCLGKTKSGAPRHPLYLRADTEVIPWP